MRRLNGEADEPTGVEPGAGVGPEALAERIRRFDAALAEIEAAGRQAEAADNARAEEALSDHEAALRRIAAELRREEEAGPPDHAETVRALEALRDGRRRQVLAAIERVRKSLTAQTDAEWRTCETRIAAAADELAEEDAERRRPMEERLVDFKAELARAEALRDETLDRIRALLRSRGIPAPDRFSEPPAGMRGDPRIDPGDAGRAARTTLEEIGRTIEAEDRRAFGGLARTGHRLAWVAFLVFAGLGLAAAAIRLTEAPAWGALPTGVFLAAAGLLEWTGRRRRAKTSEFATEAAEAAATAAATLRRHADAAEKDADAFFVKSGAERTAALARIADQHRESTRDRLSSATRKLRMLDVRAARAEAKRVESHQRRARIAALEAEREAREAARAKATAAVEHARANRHAESARRREALSAELRAAAEAARGAAAPAATPFPELAAGLTLPGDFPAYLPIGRLRLPMPDGSPAELPAGLSFPDYGSLLVRHGPEDRAAAVALLETAAYRILTSFPAGKARLTILDPAGLGESFSAFMHLADHDEALVSGRIWTEHVHLEQRLKDLTDHIETVIQKHLRNRYESIAEYNATAGELREPHRILVITDFPAGFSSLAVERLASVLASGARCGVHALISVDERQPFPPEIDLARFADGGLILARRNGAWRFTMPGIDRAEFLADAPPAAGDASAILAQVGRLGADADRVEVPFAAIAPPEGGLWSGSTERSLRVPIGRSGADRMQYFELGRGTSQHALVAGRTGSGKSTLFHVLVTNLALWFPPEEVEFYLVDFKKGVEFKSFAVNRLPHARVVAIESDREFALSVLRALDQELMRRGDLLRTAGVQDLTGFRRREPEVELPRIVLLIDEFQEFFTEDDVIARDAALLLDRFVRQGRAFGIHVVLGSQTLSGIYTIAKSTLGQMGVRIALQCNESDSSLILSEDNTLARLLSRPGDAIYNDKSGLLEGNNPFQVCWLPEEVETEALRLVRAHADARPDRIAKELVVFEGNVAADLTTNAELAALAAGAAPAADPNEDRIWLGDPNAIKGPTEVRFSAASGSHLLVVGHRRDAAFGILAAAVLSIAARRRPDEAEFVILDGGGHEPEFADHFRHLMDAVPHRIERFDARTAPDAVSALAARLAAAEAGEPGPAVYVFAFGLQRLRVLRREDEYSYREEETESPAKQFATILTDGPVHRIHVVAWCDTVANLSRTLSRQAIREFDARVLFQMSAPDSSELIDSSAANTLGLHHALLSVESAGVFEKFRPYAIPSPATMARLGGASPAAPAASVNTAGA